MLANTGMSMLHDSNQVACNLQPHMATQWWLQQELLGQGQTSTDEETSAVGPPPHTHCWPCAGVAACWKTLPHPHPALHHLRLSHSVPCRYVNVCSSLCAHSMA